MKRNLVLLTAVVLAAVLLSGCALWPFGQLKVSYAVDEELKDDFKANAKNPAKVKKNTVDFEVIFDFVEDLEAEPDEKHLVTLELTEGAELVSKDFAYVTEGVEVEEDEGEVEEVEGLEVDEEDEDNEPETKKVVTGIKFTVKPGKKDFKVTLVPVASAE